MNHFLIHMSLLDKEKSDKIINRYSIFHWISQPNLNALPGTLIIDSSLKQGFHTSSSKSQLNQVLLRRCAENPVSDEG